MSFLIGLILSVVLDFRCHYKYGYAGLSVFITKCYYNKKWKWLTCPIWGNDEWFYKKVKKSIDSK